MTRPGRRVSIRSTTAFPTTGESSTAEPELAGEGISFYNRAPRHVRRGETDVKAAILAGGYGTRLAEECGVRPEPLAEIGGRPSLRQPNKGYSGPALHAFISW